jgi:hypothetical protein
MTHGAIVSSSQVPHPHSGAQDRFPWPAPPFEWPHISAPKVDGPQACRIETRFGPVVNAYVADIDPAAREWRVGMSPTGPFTPLALSHVLRVSLDAPLRAAMRSLELGLALVPVAAHQRDYRLFEESGRVVADGRSVGHVRRDCGLFVYTAQDGGRSIRRGFVPQTAFQRVEFGPTAQEVAAQQWISEPMQLLEAFERQRTRPIPRLGQALIQLGLLDSEQLDRALARVDPARRLGERLVHEGLITQEELQTAIAFKMGFPLVDLRQFPIDPDCARRIPPDICREQATVPLFADGRRVFVAMDSPARVAGLEARGVLPGSTLCPVIAPRGQILLALSALRNPDAWPGDERRR